MRCVVGGEVLAGLLLFAGCGPDTVATAELESVCGEDGAFRLLALGADEMAGSSLRRVGERYYIAIGDAVEETDAPFSDNGFTSSIPRAENPRVMSMGPCGESPRLVAEGVRAVGELSQYPGLPIAIDDATEDLVALDPEGRIGPQVVLPRVGSLSRWVEGGVVRVDTDVSEDSYGPLVFQPFVAEIGSPPPPPRVLHERVRVSVVDDETGVLAIDGDGRLLRISVADGAATTLAENLEGFTASLDMTHVFLLERENADGRFPGFILDRATGERTWIVDATSGSLGSSRWTSVQVEVDPASGFVSKFIDLETLDAYDVAKPMSIWMTDGDGRAVAWAPEGTIVYDLNTGTHQVLFEETRNMWGDSDALLVLGAGLHGPSRYREEAPLWRYVFAEGEMERLAHRATYSFRRVDDRIFTALDVGRDYLGELVVIEPDTLEEQRIDTDVLAPRLILSDPEQLEEGTIAYAVRDGHRSGIWLARPAG